MTKWKQLLSGGELPIAGSVLAEVGELPMSL